MFFVYRYRHFSSSSFQLVASIFSSRMCLSFVQPYHMVLNHTLFVSIPRCSRSVLLFRPEISAISRVTINNEIGIQCQTRACDTIHSKYIITTILYVLCTTWIILCVLVTIISFRCPATFFFINNNARSPKTMETKITFNYLGK